MDDAPPHTQHASSLRSATPTLDWLLRLTTKRQLPKAEDLSLSLFLMHLTLMPQHREPAVASANPASDPRVGAMADVDMAIEAFAAEGRAVAAHFGCCGVCGVLMCVQ